MIFGNLTQFLAAFYKNLYSSNYLDRSRKQENIEGQPNRYHARMWKMSVKWLIKRCHWRRYGSCSYGNVNLQHRAYSKNLSRAVPTRYIYFDFVLTFSHSKNLKFACWLSKICPATLALVSCWVGSILILVLRDMIVFLL